ncbi:hypothetical protein CR513_26440, partial [Mucuna pruriens]
MIMFIITLQVRYMSGHCGRRLNPYMPQNHLNEFQGITDQMSGMGIKFEDEILGLLLLNSLLESWETFKVSITNSAPNGVVSLQMRPQRGHEKEGEKSKKEREKSRSKSKSRYKNVECHYCHKIGHIQKHCFLWKKENKGKKGDDFVILRYFESVNFVSNESMWIIDNGATLHVTQKKSSLHLTLQMGNDGVTKVIGVGDVCFNLISVHMLDDDGYITTLVMENGNSPKRRENFKTILDKCLVAKDSVNAMDMEASLWHRRLSHINEKRLTCLAKKDMLPRLKNVELEKCSHCMAGKQTRVSFKKHPPSRKSELLELVHSDVCGPLKVYVLKSKDHVLEKFKHFQTLVERQSGKKVKCIRFDNCGEYCGPFDVYCRQQGIRHEKTPPKIPQLNGLAERG